jgi:hypothetical protein
VKRTMATVVVVALGLAAAPRASAQNPGNPGQNPNQNKNLGNRDAARNNPNAGQTPTIRGVISGVALVGEVVIDHRTNRAAAAEGSYLTVIGSPVGAQDAADKKDEDKGADGRRRDNLYVIWLSPQTAVRDASGSRGDADNKDAPLKAVESTFEKLEVGDQVEVTYVSRDMGTAADRNDPARRRHGRHRVFFGTAKTIAILPDRDDDSAGGSDKGDKK